MNYRAFCVRFRVGIFKLFSVFWSSVFEGRGFRVSSIGLVLRCF